MLRSASYAIPDAPRPLATRSVVNCIFPRWSVRNDHPTIVRRSASHAFPDALRPLATRSVVNRIPTLEREERSSRLSCGALRRMPFWTLRVLSQVNSAVLPTRLLRRLAMPRIPAIVNRIGLCAKRPDGRLPYGDQVCLRRADNHWVVYNAALFRDRTHDVESIQ